MMQLFRASSRKKVLNGVKSFKENNASHVWEFTECAKILKLSYKLDRMFTADYQQRSISKFHRRLHFAICIDNEDEMVQTHYDTKSASHTSIPMELQHVQGSDVHPLPGPVDVLLNKASCHLNRRRHPLCKPAQAARQQSENSSSRKVCQGCVPVAPRP